jgi:SAM-dependent methyltransferase
LDPPVRVAPWAIDFAHLGGDERVLDIGCGNGLHLAELARRGHRGAIHGMDLSPGMLTAARSRADAALLVGDAQRLPCREGSFGCVLAMHMLYHVPDRDLALSEIRRVLRPDGVALALTNSRRHLEQLNAMIGAVVHDVNGRDPGSVRAYLSFSSESGEPELHRHFAEVERHDLRSELVVTEVEPIVAYVASMSAAVATFDGTTARRILREIEDRACAVIDTDGAFRIRTDVGCFVCHRGSRQLSAPIGGGDRRRPG